MKRVEKNLRWEEEMKASILGAEIVAQTSKAPTAKPASSLPVMLSIGFDDLHSWSISVKIKLSFCKFQNLNVKFRLLYNMAY